EAIYHTLSGQLAEARKRLDEATRKTDADQKEWEKAVAPASLPKELAPLLAQPVEKRDKKLQEKLVAHHRSLSPDWKTLDAEVRELTARVQKVSTPTPVM